MRIQWIQETHPLLFAFGVEPIAPLENEAAIAASRDERIKSVWPFLVKSVTAFQATLRAREAANFDAEDVLLELWATIAHKDHLWNPARGKYIAFAGAIVETTLLRLRDRAKTVRAPGNSTARLAEYATRESQGTLTPGQHKTAADIRRAISASAYVGEGVGRDGSESVPAAIADKSPTAPDILRRREEIGQARASVVQGISALDADQSKLLGEAFGLWGQPIRSVGAIAKSRRRSAVAIRLQIAEALARCGNALNQGSAA